jgi:hypothetical protein
MLLNINYMIYQLQESNFDFMALFTSHDSYWKSKDTALFIMSKLLQVE